MSENNKQQLQINNGTFRNELLSAIKGLPKQEKSDIDNSLIKEYYAFDSDVDPSTFVGMKYEASTTNTSYQTLQNSQYTSGVVDILVLNDTTTIVAYYMSKVLYLIPFSEINGTLTTGTAYAVFGYTAYDEFPRVNMKKIDDNRFMMVYGLSLPSSDSYVGIAHIQAFSLADTKLTLNVGSAIRLLTDTKLFSSASQATQWTSGHIEQISEDKFFVVGGCNYYNSYSGSTDNRKVWYMLVSLSDVTITALTPSTYLEVAGYAYACLPQKISDTEVMVWVQSSDGIYPVKFTLNSSLTAISSTSMLSFLSCGGAHNANVKGYSLNDGSYMLFRPRDGSSTSYYISNLEVVNVRYDSGTGVAIAAPAMGLLFKDNTSSIGPSGNFTICKDTNGLYYIASGVECNVCVESGGAIVPLFDTSSVFTTLRINSNVELYKGIIPVGTQALALSFNLTSNRHYFNYGIVDNVEFGVAPSEKCPFKNIIGVTKSLCTSAIKGEVRTMA